MGSIMFSWTFNNLTGFRARPLRRTARLNALRTPRLATRTEASDPCLHRIRISPPAARKRLEVFPKLSSWFGNRRDALYIGEINEYCQASNVTDLEQRIRVIEQRRHFRRHLGVATLKRKG